MLKKIAIIGPIVLGALVYLFAIWNASRSLTWVDRLSGETAAAMEAYGAWQWERPWTRGTPRDCQSSRVLVDEGHAVDSSGTLALKRHGLVSGEPISGPVEGLEAARDAARTASACRYAGTEDAFTLDGVATFDWNAHLDIVTRLAIDGVRSEPDVCLATAASVAELAYDASVGGGLGALSYAQIELELATALVERCSPGASYAALGDASRRMDALANADTPFWRTLIAESLLVEVGARNAAGDIRVLPAGPLQLKDAVFTGTILQTWSRAVEAREALPETVEAQGPVEAAGVWESVFEDRDDAYEHAVAARPAQRIDAFVAAAKRLTEASRELDVERASRSYRSFREGTVLNAFERRYTVDAADN